MINFKFFGSSLVLVMIIFLLVSPSVLANNGDNQDSKPLVELKERLDRIGGALFGKEIKGEEEFYTWVGNLIRLFFGILGITFLILTVYGGYLWMTAGGDAEQITKATGWIKNGAIGLGIILAAFAITEFILLKVLGMVFSAP